MAGWIRPATLLHILIGFGVLLFFIEQVVSLGGLGTRLLIIGVVGRVLYTPPVRRWIKSRT